MTRSADYTIQGFIFQFNKTLVELLSDMEDSVITVEGIIEDIEVQNVKGIKGIQCKYHEGQEKYTLSLIYKPILQMMEHFCNNPDIQISYRLYVYFPGELERTDKLTAENVCEIFKSKNQKLKSYICAVKDKIDINKFVGKFSIEFGKSLEMLVSESVKLLKDNGVPEDEIETIIYPNAIHKIASISILHDVCQRKIKKSKFINDLLEIRKTAISIWTRGLKTYNKILEIKKSQLKNNLNVNSRLRYFVISDKALVDFDTNIVTFMDEYLGKYHFKILHDKTPVFCLDCSDQKFKDLVIRAHKKSISFTTGFIIGRYFDEKWFLREPMIKKVNAGFEREFSIRLLRYSSDSIQVINRIKCDDLFVISLDEYPEIDTQDVNVEFVGVENSLELKYILGMRDTHE